MTRENVDQLAKELLQHREERRNERRSRVRKWREARFYRKLSRVEPAALSSAVHRLEARPPAG